MTRPLNICAFSRVNYWQGVKGGMDLHGLLLSEGLVRRGHRVTMISSRHPRGIVREQKNGVDIHYLPDTVFGARRHGWARKSVGHFEAMHKKDPFDLIWSQSFDAFGFARPGRNRLHPPIVATLHGSIAQEWKSFQAEAWSSPVRAGRILKGMASLGYAYFLCQSPLLRIADRIVCVSPVVAEDIGKWFGRRFQERCRIIENGIDTGFFRPDPEQGRQIRRLHEIRDDEVLLLSLGRLTFAKGHQIAIRALKKVLDQNIDARLIIAGAGEYDAALASLAEGLGLRARVDLAGFVNHDRAVGYYNAADIFLMPTMTVEGLPFVLLEAMSCGTPVIASGIGGNAVLLKDSDHGLLTAPGDADALSRKIVDLVDHRERMKFLAINGRKRVVEKYSLDRMIAETLTVMSEVVTCA